jgi:type IV pilus assembly protein PilX
MLAQYSHTGIMQLRARQTGVVMVITLIVLVAMTLAAIALVRSVDTTNVIAGNLAFKQATINSADRGTEAAVAWLESAGNLLYLDNPPNGYSASQQQPAANDSWDNYWNTRIVPNNLAVCVPTNCNPDAAGNVVSYTIHRLCNGPNAPSSLPDPICSSTPSSYAVAGGSSRGSSTKGLNTIIQNYYRITIRTAGPRNTVSYAQAVVAL